MMPVEISQWRATIGCFCVSIQTPSPLGKNIVSSCSRPQALLVLLLSTIVLPLALMIQFLAVHTVATQLCFFIVDRTMVSCLCLPACITLRRYFFTRLFNFSNVFRTLSSVLFIISVQPSSNIFFSMRIFTLGA